MRQDIDTLMFDLDGTLVDSWPAMHEGILFTLGELGLPGKTFDEVLAFGPKGMIDLWQQVLESKDPSTVDRAIGIYKESFARVFYKKTVAFPGVEDMLNHFRKKTKIVVTNGLADLSWQILAHVKLDRYFDDLIGGDDIGCVKPMACPLERGMDRFEDAAPGALMTGDMVVDVEAGKAAGVLTCAVTYGIGSLQALEKACPDYIIHHPGELKRIVAT